ncbi:MAG: hypothetical protein TEF_14060 [Rhizobiales bacterium NRL2]|jgi:CheY-like chemotaxis protein|nr:MAG: hypothetical protein TEF_14060 [Rhizobiales bacterium NRL2]
MAHLEVNLEHVTILVADPHDGSRRIVGEMLHALGARNVIAVTTVEAAREVLGGECVDLMICDYRLSEGKGAAFISELRADRTNLARSIPVLITCSHTRLRDVQAARDCGANMVLVKPHSVTSLYDRLAWVAHRPRPFVSSSGYNGPSRRFRDEVSENRPARRKDDDPIDGEAGEAAVEPARASAG